MLTAGQYFLQLQGRTVVEMVVCEVFSVVCAWFRWEIKHNFCLVFSIFLYSSFLEPRRLLFVDGHFLAMLFLP